MIPDLSVELEISLSLVSSPRCKFANISLVSLRIPQAACPISVNMSARFEKDGHRASFCMLSNRVEINSFTKA